MKRAQSPSSVMRDVASLVIAFLVGAVFWWTMLAVAFYSTVGAS